MQIDLTTEERRMIILALVNKPFKEAVNNHLNPAVIRITYKGLLEKLQKDEKLHQGLESSMGGGLLVRK